MPNRVSIVQGHGRSGPKGLTFGIALGRNVAVVLAVVPLHCCTFPPAPVHGGAVADRRFCAVDARGGEPHVCTCWRLSKRQFDRVMTAVGVPVRPTSVRRSKFVKPDPMSGAPGPIDAVTPSGGCHDAVADRPDGIGDRDVSRELPNRLIAAAVRGDCRARDELLALIQPLVLRYCRGRLGRQELLLGSADDVAQEVCVAVVSALGSYQPAGLSFRAFVYGIAAHKVADAFRAIGRNRTEPVAELPEVPVVTDGPEHHALAAERSAALGVLLAQLTPRQREVLVLRVAVGLSAEEAAEAVGSSAGTVRVTQHRALARLRRLLQQGDATAQVTVDSAPDDPVRHVTPK